MFSILANTLNIVLDYLFIMRLNYGMKGAALATGISVIVAFVLSFGATEGIVRVFSHENTELMKIANYGIKIYSIAFFINGFNMVASAYFTSLGDAKTSMLISALRSLILINILVFVLPVFLGDTGIWLITPLTEAITFIVSYVFIRRSRARLFFPDNYGPNTAEA